MRISDKANKEIASDVRQYSGNIFADGPHLSHDTLEFVDLQRKLNNGTLMANSCSPSLLR
jgi:hypothetical protein